MAHFLDRLPSHGIPSGGARDDMVLRAKLDFNQVMLDWMTRNRCLTIAESLLIINEYTKLSLQTAIIEERKR